MIPKSLTNAENSTNTTNTFLQRMQPLIDAMPKGPDKEKLRSLVQSQDNIERVDVQPRERAMAMRQLMRPQRVSTPTFGPQSLVRNNISHST